MEDIELQEQEVIASPSKKNEDQDAAKRNTLPIYTLNEILAMCAKIYSLGYGSYHSKELICQHLDTPYGSLKQRFSTAQLYGLLELKHRVGYKITPLFLKIHKPINEKERKESVIEALRSSDIYNTLLDEFNGHPSPPEQGLGARLLRTYGIKDYVAIKAAQVFLSNLRENGLEINGQVSASIEVSQSPLSSVVSQGNSEKATPAPPPQKIEQPLQGYIEIPIPLQGGKRAYIKIPEDYKPEDCDRIAKFVEALK